MSAYTFTIKQNDMKPDLIAFLKNSDKTPIDLTDADEVVFTMVKNGASTPKINKVAAVLEDAINGEVHYNWQAGDTDTIGTYKGEFEIVWAEGITQTLPQDDYIKVIIKDDIA